METRRHGPIFQQLARWLKKNTEGEMLLEWVVYIILFVVMVLFILNHTSDIPGWRFYGTVLDLALLLVLNILWMTQHKALTGSSSRKWLFLAVSWILALIAVGLGGLYSAVYVLFMVIAQGSVTMGVWPVGTIISLVNLAAWVGIFQITTSATTAEMFDYGTSLLVGIIFTLFLVTLLNRNTQQMQRTGRLYAELQAANTQLEAARLKEKELAIAEERVRLARDIHDGLGHHLTVLSIQLQAASKLVERNPQAASDAIQVCRVEAQSALNEVRYSVGMMRQSVLDGQSLGQSLASLVENFDQRTGIRVNLVQTGNPVGLAAFARETIYRAVQECLTNAQKHGKNIQHVQVQLDSTPQAVHLIVSDDGEKPDTTRDSERGYGLKGLCERVNQLGGSVRSGAGQAGGFEVVVDIPLQEALHDPGLAG